MNTSINTGPAIAARFARTAEALDKGIAFFDSIGRPASFSEAATLSSGDPFLVDFLGMLMTVRRERADVLRSARKAIDDYLRVVNSSNEQLRAAFLLGMSAAWVRLSLVGREHIQLQQQRVLEAIDDYREREAKTHPDRRWMLAKLDPFAALPEILTPDEVVPGEALSEYLAILQEEDRCLRSLL